MKDYLKFRLLLTFKQSKLKIVAVIGLILVSCLLYFNRSMQETEYLYQKEKLLEQKDNLQEMNRLYQSEKDSTSEQWLQINENRLSGIETFIKGDDFGYMSYENSQFDEYRKAEPLQSNGMSLTMSKQQEKEHGFDIYSFIKGKELVNQTLLKETKHSESIRYGSKNWLFVLSLQKYLTSFIGLTVFLLIFGFNQLIDIERGKNKLYGVQPIKRQRIYVIDFSTFMTMSIVSYLFLLLYGYTISTLFYGRVDMSYPILVNSGIKGLMTIPIWQVILKTSLLFIFNLMIAYFLLVGVVLVTRKAIASVAVMATVIIFLSVISSYPLPSSTNKISAFNPFIYFNPQEIYLKTSDEAIGNIWESYGITEDNGTSITSYEYNIFYENVDYYMGKNKIYQSQNDRISWQKGLVSLALSSGLLGWIIGKFYNRKMCS